MTVREFRLTRITDCDTAVQDAILRIRNEAGVRRHMYTDRLISPEEHRRYLDGLRTDVVNVVYAVVDSDGAAVGAASYIALSATHRRSDWAFYLSESCRGVGRALEWTMIERAFGQMDLAKLNCEVLETNPAVRDLHLSFGFVEEGFRRSHVVNGGVRRGVHLLGLTREDWAAAREDVLRRIAPKMQGLSFRFSGDKGSAPG